MKKNRTMFGLFALLLGLTTQLVQAKDASRGVARIDGESTQGPALSEHYSASHALLIGVSDYDHPGWERLDSVQDELAAVGSVLKQQGFEVETLTNLSGRELMNRLTDFVVEKGYDENNRLLVYFSGHGETIKLSKNRPMGYFVPADAPPYAVDKRGFITRALSMNRVMAMAKEIRSKHALFVFDSCFSGAIFQSRSFASNNNRSLERLLSKPVRYFITSGSANETVPSDSVFARAFVDSFATGAADLNGDGYVTSTELGLHLTQNVRLGNQTPQHGKINDYELSQGDVVFSSLVGPRMDNGVRRPAAAIAAEFKLRAELYFWQALQSDPSEQGYDEYLRRYPDGQFVVLAEQGKLGLDRQSAAAAPASAEPVAASIKVGITPAKLILSSMHWTGDWTNSDRITDYIDEAMRARLERRGLQPQALSTERSSGSWVKRKRSTYGIDRRVFSHMTEAGQGIMGVVVRMRDDNSSGELQFVFSSGRPEQLSKRYHFYSHLGLKRATKAALDQVLESELDIVMR